MSNTAEPTPQQAWDELVAGNNRFVTDDVRHPNQDIARRHLLEAGQKPKAILFGCGDSRVASEIIFDQGLGDLFVVRTAGHIIDNAVLGSIEFGVGVLGVPLIVVLGHDSCGAIKATLDSAQSGDMPGGFVRDIVERVMPSVISGRGRGLTTPEEFEAEHVRATTGLLTERSIMIHDAVQEGRLGIVGATYHLREGSASAVNALGAVTVA
ncbi:carbonic anhydrase [Flexivirga meconopsidis]|uniref:carbonic anhydrase n=1 Tax=Flexivirga meconopsidis TaxID=2977121 RepID=UPI00223FAD13